MKNKTFVISLLSIVVFAVSAAGSTFAIRTYEQNQLEQREEFLASATSNSPRKGTVQTKSLAEISLEKMTVEQKVGQLFILGFKFDQEGDGMTELSEQAKQTISYCRPGGVILTGYNMSTPPQTTEFLLDAKNAYPDYPMFISVDEEGGSISRLNLIGIFSEEERIPAPLTIAQDETPQDAYNYMQTIATELSDIGFNMNFAPSCDIYSNPDNTVIGDRAYGTTAEQVSNYIPSAIAGLQDNGIIAVAKHFPGHGDTFVDTHYALAEVDHDLERLKGFEFLPFQTAIEAGVDVIMTAHIKVPNVTGTEDPATISKEMITDILKGDLGFEGLVITDALDMDAIIDNYRSGDVAVAAVKAGVDILLMPQDPKEAYDAVLAEVKSGGISAQQLDETVLKILELKYKYGILK